MIVDRTSARVGEDLVVANIFITSKLTLDAIAQVGFENISSVASFHSRAYEDPSILSDGREVLLTRTTLVPMVPGELTVQASVVVAFNTRAKTRRLFRVKSNAITLAVRDFEELGVSSTREAVKRKPTVQADPPTWQFGKVQFFVPGSAWSPETMQLLKSTAATTGRCLGLHLNKDASWRARAPGAVAEVFLDAGPDGAGPRSIPWKNSNPTACLNPFLDALVVEPGGATVVIRITR